MTINVDAQQLSMIFRILVAGICGILIGLERKNRSKEAGVRTHCEYLQYYILSYHYQKFEKI